MEVLIKKLRQAHIGT